MEELEQIIIFMFQAMRTQSEQHLWMSNNRLLENTGCVMQNPNTQQQNINEWALGLNMQPLYSQLSQPQ